MSLDMYNRAMAAITGGADTDTASKACVMAAYEKMANEEMVFSSDFDRQSAATYYAGQIAQEIQSITRGWTPDQNHPDRVLTTRAARAVILGNDPNKTTKVFSAVVTGYDVASPMNRLLVHLDTSDQYAKPERDVRTPRLDSAEGALLFKDVTGFQLVPAPTESSVQVPTYTTSKQNGQDNLVIGQQNGVLNAEQVGNGLIGHRVLLNLHLEQMRGGQGNTRVVVAVTDLGAPRQG